METENGNKNKNENEKSSYYFSNNFLIRKLQVWVSTKRNENKYGWMIRVVFEIQGQIGNGAETGFFFPKCYFQRSATEMQVAPLDKQINRGPQPKPEPEIDDNKWQALKGARSVQKF